MTATITSRDGMQQALEQLARLYEGLAALRRDVEPLNPRNFATLAEGHLDQIRGLQRELDVYAGAVAAVVGCPRVSSTARFHTAELDIVWDVVQSHLPPLGEKARKLLDKF